MTKKVYCMILLFIIIAGSAFANVRIDKMSVNGNCTMCEQRIENAALSVEGVSNANWNKRTKTMVLSFNPSITDIKAISRIIANAGHDTVLLTANEIIYSKLPECCKYKKGVGAENGNPGKATSESDGHSERIHQTPDGKTPCCPN